MSVEIKTYPEKNGLCVEQICDACKNNMFIDEYDLLYSLKSEMNEGQLVQELPYEITNRIEFECPHCKNINHFKKFGCYEYEPSGLRGQDLIDNLNCFTDEQWQSLLEEGELIEHQNRDISWLVNFKASFWNDRFKSPEELMSERAILKQYDSETLKDRARSLEFYIDHMMVNYEIKDYFADYLYAYTI
jgi:hypothetical protein